MSSIARFDTWQAADGTNVARYNAGVLEVWDGAAWGEPSSGIELQYVVVGGGGAGAPRFYSGGGGAGGYLSNVPGEQMGRGLAAGHLIYCLSGDSFSVVVGAGGAAISSTSNSLRGNNGSYSRFGPIVASGGQGGAGASQQARGGGSGGGCTGYNANFNGVGTDGQGYDGGITSGNYGAGGGGGAGANGGNGTSSAGGNGGDGVASSITGSSVYRAGGGAGGGYSVGYATGGLGGGGDAQTATTPGDSGAANTGGGGAGSMDSTLSSAGGSGVVIVKYPATASLTIGAGLTASTVTSGDYKITTFTAGTDTVTVN